MREALKNDVPELWRQRRKAGLCPVCGKTKVEFEKGRRVFCSQECNSAYAEKYTYWSEVRDEILRRDDHTCQNCGISNKTKFEKAEQEEKRRFKEWAEAHKKELEAHRDRLLVNWENYWKKQYDRILDDEYVVRDLLDWDEKHKLLKGIRKNVYFEVDHKVAVALGGDMWDKNNLQTLCNECHKKKTAKDMKKIALKKNMIGEKDEQTGKQTGN